MNQYSAGSTVKLLASFTMPGGAAFDPTTVTFSVISPNSREVQSLSVVHDGLGNYHAEYVAAHPGLYAYRVGSANPSAAAEGSFVVKDTQFV